MHISTGEANLIPLKASEALGKDGKEYGDTIYRRLGMIMGNGRAVKDQVSDADSEWTCTIVSPKSAQESHTPMGWSRSMTLRSLVQRSGWGQVFVLVDHKRPWMGNGAAYLCSRTLPTMMGTRRWSYYRISHPRAGHPVLKSSESSVIGSLRLRAGGCNHLG